MGHQIRNNRFLIYNHKTVYEEAEQDILQLIDKCVHTDDYKKGYQEGYSRALEEIAETNNTSKEWNSDMFKIIMLQNN